MKELGWHFLANDSRLRFKPRRLIKSGMTLRRDPNKLELCEYGLHWSERALDALKYARGGIICRIEASGKIIYGYDKAVSSVRKVLWMADANEILQAFARWCALQVVDLWDAPDVVVQFLKTGDEEIKIAAAGAAGAAWDARADDVRAARAAWAAGAAKAAEAAWDAGAAAWAAWAARADVRAAGAAKAAKAAEAAQNEKLEEMLLGLEVK